MGVKQKGHYPELISHLYGKKDKGEFGKSYLLNRYSNYEIENREGMMHKLSIPVKISKEKRSRNKIIYNRRTKTSIGIHIHIYINVD